MTKVNKEPCSRASSPRGNAHPHESHPSSCPSEIHVLSAGIGSSTRLSASVSRSWSLETLAKGILIVSSVGATLRLLCALIDTLGILVPTLSLWQRQAWQHVSTGSHKPSCFLLFISPFRVHACSNPGQKEFYY